jgi:hypothetical protein
VHIFFFMCRAGPVRNEIEHFPFRRGRISHICPPRAILVAFVRFLRGGAWGTGVCRAISGPVRDAQWAIGAGASARIWGSPARCGFLYGARWHEGAREKIPAALLLFRWQGDMDDVGYYYCQRCCAVHTVLYSAVQHGIEKR